MVPAPDTSRRSLWPAPRGPPSRPCARIGVAGRTPTHADRGTPPVPATPRGHSHRSPAVTCEFPSSPATVRKARGKGKGFVTKLRRMAYALRARLLPLAVRPKHPYRNAHGDVEL